MLLIADSGSTKTEWTTPEATAITRGINPVRDNQTEILEVIRTELMPQLFPHSSGTDTHDITEIHFYGAGCIPPFAQSVSEALTQTFPTSSVHIYTDLLGAARALCGKDEGIACILGTGSNSCLCKDGEIVHNVSPLGYILGDEGSGAVLGRILLSEMAKGDLQHLWPAFSQHYNLSPTDVINKVYRQPQANRFLASLAPFIKKNISEPAVRDMVVNEFSRFLHRNVLPYGRTDLSINFIGGIANNFNEEISTACQLCGLKMGNIISRPAKSLLNYHILAI